MKKHKSHILAVTNLAAIAAVAGNDSKFVKFEDDLDSFPFGVDDVWVGPRNVLENDENFRQVIPYVIIERNNGILLYQRTPKGGEARLHNKVSIGFGGHIDVGDIAMNDSNESIDLETTVGNAVQREIMEELQTDHQYTFEAYGMILDNSDHVGRVHIGIVMIARVNCMVMAGEDQITLHGFKSIGDLEGYYTGLETDKDKNAYEMESWSKAIVADMVKNGIPS